MGLVDLGTSSLSSARITYFPRGEWLDLVLISYALLLQFVSCHSYAERVRPLLDKFTEYGTVRACGLYHRW
ncbi:hypothetical protein CSPX01_02658 [Colletotrichum filicis]|nr:hypothetical protein CSPX01_02658 [Colletotrichum filicis]